MATSSHPQRQAEFTTSNTEPNHGTRTMTLTMENQDQGTPDASSSQPSLLVLRARPLEPINARQPKVQWGENVIDNEGLGRKKSKVCCIYKKPKAFDESSDESDDDSGSECCRHSPPSTSQTPTTNPTPRNHSHSPEPRPSTHPPTALTPNAYEVEPINPKGKGKA
ncbi:hypothetical protein CROQUDRAFT_134482 [Cronartium quercuum f. sp. fusiforme G11]|uniref:Type 1 phosphatases regulator n=1 Tax=Cronartium quercuum f. sp. fusiforme G11 TaxID=708437 RepID=A0A9P6NHH1_9BASI|nr:hypothetical protein CROQUDRAFT_134482 [Cronartium quercuum f. sp. fusiforme G11]